MKAITNTKLTMALGAALVVGSLVTNAAKAGDFSEFSSNARARVLQEATTQPDAAERVRRLRKSLEDARIVAGFPEAGAQRELALATIRQEQLADFHAGAPLELETTMAGAGLKVRAPAARTEEAIAAIQAEQMQAMRIRSLRQLADSMTHGPVMVRVVVAAGAGEFDGWNLP